MRIFRPILYLIIILLGSFLLFLIYIRVEDYRPPDQVTVSENDQAPELSDSSTLNLVIWNIGYAGLDASMDFFYDGGRQMRPAEEGVIRNMKGIVENLTPFTEYDVVLLQEVDQGSKRSYHLNQYEVIEGHFPDHKAYFGMNYRVPFVPIPLKEPMGKVRSGLMTLSRPLPIRVVRHQFPGNYSWPMKLFMLDRCFLVNRYPLSSGRELLVINTHNSAYDDGSLRRGQMAYLKEFLLKEYGRGNYIVVGGDWNQSPYGLSPELPEHRFDTINLTYVEEGYPAPDWNWAYDPMVPTNRRVSEPYDRSRSLTTIIDYYLLSPNIRVKYIKTVDLDFRYSDHQPVQLQVELLPEHPR
jgi:endonuclease/exonuclease/phosphatase family metal-dependent hydrolase